MKNGLNVSLSRQGGFAVVTPAMIDQGSYDDCSTMLDLEIAIEGTFDYRDQLVFDCDDLGNNRVELRVTDELGNENICWLDVLVELKLNDTPTCIAPGTVTLNCIQYAAVLPPNIEEATDAELDAAFGFGSGTGTCGATVIERADQQQPEQLWHRYDRAGVHLNRPQRPDEREQLYAADHHRRCV